MEATHDFDQRRLAAGVVADEAEGLTSAQVQADVAQRDHFAEALGDTRHAQDVIGRPYMVKGGRPVVLGIAALVHQLDIDADGDILQPMGLVHLGPRELAHAVPGPRCP